MNTDGRYSKRGAMWAVSVFIVVLLFASMLVPGQHRGLVALLVALTAAAATYWRVAKHEQLMATEQPTAEMPPAPPQTAQAPGANADRSITLKDSFVTRRSAMRVLPKLNLDLDENVILWISHWSIGALLFRIPVVKKRASEPGQKPDPSVEPLLEWQSTRGIFAPALAVLVLWAVALMIGFSINPLPSSIPGGKEVSSARTALIQKVNEATQKPGAKKKQQPTPAVWERHIAERYARLPLLLSLLFLPTILMRWARWSTWYIVLTGEQKEDGNIEAKRLFVAQRPFKALLLATDYRFPFLFSKIQSASIVGTRLQHWMKLTLVNITTYLEHEDDWILDGLRGLPRSSRLVSIVNQLIKEQVQQTPFEDATASALERNTRAVEGLTAILEQRGGDWPTSA